MITLCREKGFTFSDGDPGEYKVEYIIKHIMNTKTIKRKIKKVIDDPGISIEKGLKKGLETTKDFGKEVKNTVIKKSSIK